MRDRIGLTVTVFSAAVTLATSVGVSVHSADPKSRALVHATAHCHRRGLRTDDVAFRMCVLRRLSPGTKFHVVVVPGPETRPHS